MGFLKKLLNVGAIAGATVAAVRVSDKYKQNNPDGVQDVNGDGKVDAKDVFAEVSRAASEVYHDAAATVKEKGPAYVKKAQDVVTETFGGGESGNAQ